MLSCRQAGSYGKHGLKDNVAAMKPFFNNANMQMQMLKLIQDLVNHLRASICGFVGVIASFVGWIENSRLATLLGLVLTQDSTLLDSGLACLFFLTRSASILAC